MKRYVGYLAATLFLAMPLSALAADGYVTVNLNMRAGPDVQYPVVDTLPVGTEVSIQGCTDGWQWCDVIAGNERGWVDGRYVQDEYRGRRVQVLSDGARLGIPIIGFAIGAYWNSHYRNRSFYRNRDTWYHRDIKSRAPEHHDTRREPARRDQHRGAVEQHREQSHAPQHGRQSSRMAQPHQTRHQAAPRQAQQHAAGNNHAHAGSHGGNESDNHKHGSKSHEHEQGNGHGH